MGLFGGLVNTWKNGYQFGDITKSLLYDLNPIAWAGDALVKNIQGDKDFDMFENNPNWTPSAEDPIDQGIVNTWNKMTGNAHLTPEAQHAEEREDTINQRTATDMMLAGLSKFGMSGSSAGASSHANGLTMLDMIGKAQQIQAQAQSLKEMKYNLGVSKRLGIRTGDKNSLGQLTSIAKALFGLDLSDIPDEGIIPYFVNILKGAGATGNGSTVGAAADAAGATASTGARATDAADATKVSKPLYNEPVVNMGLDSYKPVSEILSSTAEKGTTAWLRDNLLKDKSHITSDVSRYFTDGGNFTAYGEKYLEKFANRYKMSYDDAARLIYDWCFDYFK